MVGWAQAVPQAWDAELFLAKGATDAQAQGAVFRSEVFFRGSGGAEGRGAMGVDLGGLYGYEAFFVSCCFLVFFACFVVVSMAMKLLFFGSHLKSDQL